MGMVIFSCPTTLKKRTEVVFAELAGKLKPHYPVGVLTVVTYSHLHIVLM